MKMTCKDCLHYDVCGYMRMERGQFKGCVDFKDKSRYVEQRHGKWIDCSEADQVRYYRCSVCRFVFPIFKYTEYCQHCGAKMDGKEDT